MQVRDAIRKAPAVVTAAATLRTAAELMDRDVVGSLAVVDGDQLVGIITDRDLVVRGMARGAGLEEHVGSVMSTEVVTIDASADLRDALKIFRTHPFRRLPVIDRGRVVGFITVDDLVIDLTADLADLVRPVTGQVIFGHPEPAVPVSSTS